MDEEGTDFTAITQKKVTAQGNEYEEKNHAMTLDMAKEIAMLQRNQIGRQIRLYFINYEKKT